MNRTIPELKDQVIDLLSRVRPEQLSRLDNEPDAMRCLQDALMKTRDVLNLSLPPAGVPIKAVKTWCARRPDAAHDQFSHGPAKSLDDLGNVPEGHVVIGFTEDHERIVEGIVIEGDLEGTYLAKSERLDAANHFLGTLYFPEGLSHIPMEQMPVDSEYCEWQFDDVEDQWTQDVLVLRDEDKKPIGMSLLVQFAEFSNEIISAKFDGVDIMPKRVNRVMLRCRAETIILRMRIAVPSHRDRLDGILSLFRFWIEG